MPYGTWEIFLCCVVSPLMRILRSRLIEAQDLSLSVFIDALLIRKVMNTTKEFTPIISCPVYTKFDRNIIDSTNFWLDGVVKINFAICGIIVNFVGLFVLNRPSMKNPFNFNLSAIAVIDLAYLIIETLKTLYVR